MKILLVSCAVAVAVACSSPPRPEPAPVEPAAATTAPAPEPRQVAAETSITSDWGATITIPASWYVLEGPEVIRIEGPNRELTIWLAAATVADRDAAIEQAWKRIDPEFSLETAQTINVPGRDGWDAITQRVYVTRAEYQRVVMVSARRLGDVWHLAMIDGKVMIAAVMFVAAAGVGLWPVALPLLAGAMFWSFRRKRARHEQLRAELDEGLERIAGLLE
jgi:hypothetical protein